MRALFKNGRAVDAAAVAKILLVGDARWTQDPQTPSQFLTAYTAYLEDGGGLLGDYPALFDILQWTESDNDHTQSSAIKTLGQYFEAGGEIGPVTAAQILQWTESDNDRTQRSAIKTLGQYFEAGGNCTGIDFTPLQSCLSNTTDALAYLMAAHMALHIHAAKQKPANPFSDQATSWLIQAANFLTQAYHLDSKNPAIVISYAAMAVHIAKKSKDNAKKRQAYGIAEKALDGIKDHIKARDFHAQVCAAINLINENVEVPVLDIGIPTILGMRTSSIFRDDGPVPRGVNRTTNDVMGWTTNPRTGRRIPPPGFPWSP